MTKTSVTTCSSSPLLHFPLTSVPQLCAHRALRKLATLKADSNGVVRLSEIEEDDPNAPKPWEVTPSNIPANASASTHHHLAETRIGVARFIRRIKREYVKREPSRQIGTTAGGCILDTMQQLVPTMSPTAASSFSGS